MSFFEDGEPLAGEPYALTVDGNLRSGTLDEEGFLHESIPPNAKSAVLTTGDGEPIDIKLGTLDPATTVSGVQGRLANLAFNPGPIDGKLGPQTRRALRRFQEARGLKTTGEIDESTRAALVAAFGS